jgi:hypothetical protein
MGAIGISRPTAVIRSRPRDLEDGNGRLTGALEPKILPHATDAFPMRHFDENE